MRPPFFIVEANGDVSAYDSAAHAESSVESVDVEGGEYRAAYDADGRLLELFVETPTKRSKCWLVPWFESIQLTPVRLRPLESDATHQHELRAALVTGLARLGIDVPALVPLDTVVAQAASSLKRR
jgi:hypothetical protein